MSTRESEDATRRWADFQRLDQMVNHWWWRPGWKAGRSYYTFHLTFEAAPEVRELAAHYQELVRLPTLDPVPPEGLHATLQGIGFADEVSGDDLNRITDEASSRCSALAPFTVDVGPADGDAEGVPLAVTPWEPVERLRVRLREAVAAVWGDDRVPDQADGFRPHVTVFYSNAESDPRALATLLDPLRDTPPVTTIIRSVSLIQLDRDEQVYRWRTRTSIPLGGVDQRDSVSGNRQSVQS